MTLATLLAPGLPLGARLMVKHRFQLMCSWRWLSPHSSMRTFVQHPDLFALPHLGGTENFQAQSSPISEMAFGSMREPQAAMCTTSSGGGGEGPRVFTRALLLLPQSCHFCCPVCSSPGCEEGRLPRSVSQILGRGRR